jgi:chaperone LolA
MKKILPALLTTALSLQSAAVDAAAIDQLHAFAADTKSARGEFTQRIGSGGNARLQKRSEPNTGEFIFARPGKFRWAYLKPYEQLIVADGQTLSIYDKDLNQVTTRKLTDALGATPAAILFGGSELEKGFDLKEAGVKDGVEWLEATPKTKDTQFERIAIGFRNGELAAMELHDAFGQVTQLTFSNVQRNPVIAPDTFKFVPPKGADVLQN